MTSTYNLPLSDAYDEHLRLLDECSDRLFIDDLTRECLTNAQSLAFSLETGVDDNLPGLACETTATTAFIFTELMSHDAYQISESGTLEDVGYIFGLHMSRNKTRPNPKALVVWRATADLTGHIVNKALNYVVYLDLENPKIVDNADQSLNEQNLYEFSEVLDIYGRHFKYLHDEASKAKLKLSLMIGFASLGLLFGYSPLPLETLV